LEILPNFLEWEILLTNFKNWENIKIWLRPVSKEFKDMKI
jgi:hypothetical protein